MASCPFLIMLAPNPFRSLKTRFLLQDNFGRLHDRSKETPKILKQLSRLFPNKVAIQSPQVIKILVAYDLYLSNLEVTL